MKRIPTRICMLCGNPCWGRTCYICFAKKHYGQLSRSKPVKQIKATCEQCGIEFCAFKSNEKFCSEKCHTKHHNHKHSALRKKWLKDNPEKVREYELRKRLKKKEEVLNYE